ELFKDVGAGDWSRYKDKKKADAFMFLNSEDQSKEIKLTRRLTCSVDSSAIWISETLKATGLSSNVSNFVELPPSKLSLSIPNASNHIPWRNVYYGCMKLIKRTPSVQSCRF
ncbi:unnamed protein product, partial [Allacma fusca]